MWCPSEVSQALQGASQYCSMDVAKKRATLLAQTSALLGNKRTATAAAILLISGGCYSYYLQQLSARQKKR